MKILYIGDLDLERGGAMWRTYYTLPYISKHFETVVLCAGHLSAEFVELFNKNGIRVMSAQNISPKSLMYACVSEKADLIVVPWEYPVYLVSAYLASKNLGIPYAVLVHGLPIIGTPLKVTRNYRSHAFLKVLDELKGDIAHNVKRSLGAAFRRFATRVMAINTIYKAMRRAFILAVGPVSELYVKSYFRDHGKVFTIKPGNGFEPPSKEGFGSKFIYDACFMAARLSGEKGLFDLLRIASMVSRRRSVRVAVMGRFADASEESKFYSMCGELGMTGSVDT